MLFFAEKIRTSGPDWTTDRGGDGVIAYSSEIPFSLFNFIAGLDVRREASIRMAEEICEGFIDRGVPWLWWTTPSYTSPDLEQLLDRHGLRSGVVPGMYRPLDNLPDLDGSVLIDEVAADDEDFADTLVAGFGMPDFVREPMREMMSIFTDEEQVSLVARVDEDAVGVGTGLISGETLGIYNIATLPEARGRGVGTAVTGMLLRVAAERGCTHAVLHSSSMGRPVYERLGFDHVCDTRQWNWAPPG
jgi:GNAT superfamily N-acetyltransferase